MTNGGDAAEQLIRVSLSGTEMVLRLVGTGIKELGTFIAAACKNPERRRKKQAAKHGETRLKTLLTSGKPLEVFSLKEEDLKMFVDSAKKYGILYCVVKNPKDCPDNLCDILVRADDAPKIARIAERYGFTTLSKATVEQERERAARAEPEPEAPNHDTADDLVSDLLGKKEGREQTRPNPDMAKTEHPHPSAPSSESRPKSARGTFEQERPSVRGELREITESRKAKKPEAPVRDERRADPARTSTHTQPKRGRNSKKQIRRNTR